MNGGHLLLHALGGLGVDTCFMNPGTTEMHIVAALDQAPAVRPVLTLFEGVATGAADGYGRLRGRPAATLLHLGPGLANGVANLHNAKRARTPIVNLVGDHATYHRRYDAPLQSDIRALACTVSGWYRESVRASDVPDDVAAAVAAACGPPGQVATLVLPADVSWSEAKVDHPSPMPLVRPVVPSEHIEAVARTLASGEPATLLLGGSALGAEPLESAARVAEATSTRMLAETFPARHRRGAGLPPIERLAYLPELAIAQLQGTRHLVLVDASRPTSFFAYQGQPSDLVPDGCETTVLVPPGGNAQHALAALATELGAASAKPARVQPNRPAPPTGPLSGASLAAAVGATLPEEAVVVDESNTAGIHAPSATASCPPHDWLCLTGGAIGQGIPVATGAALAAPGRRVLCLEADGSAMYTLQGLWTQAREGLDVTTVLIANRSYAILQLELSRVGAGPPGPRAGAMLDLSRPDLDWVALARGMGISARQAQSAEELTAALSQALREPGPSLIEAVTPSTL